MCCCGDIRPGISYGCNSHPLKDVEDKLTRLVRDVEEKQKNELTDRYSNPETIARKILKLSEAKIKLQKLRGDINEIGQQLRDL